MTDRMSKLGVVLAGGQSRRMQGQEKGLMQLGGMPLIAHVAQRLMPQAGEVILNANGDADRFSRIGLAVVADTVEGFAGPLAGVLAAMQWAEKHRPRVTHVLSAAADTPFFPATLGEQLAQAAPSPQAIVLARSNGNRHPVFGLWPVALAGELQAFLASGENPKVMLFVQAHEHAFADFAMLDLDGGPFDPFFNVNTPQEFSLAQAMMRAIEERGRDGA